VKKLNSGRGFSPGTPASSITKTGHHDIAEILLKVALKPQKNQSTNHIMTRHKTAIMATSFSGGRSRSTQREPPTMGKQRVNFITCGCESSAPFFCNLQSRARTHAVLVIDLYEHEIFVNQPTHNH
jgi:hypothetical protein